MSLATRRSMGGFAAGLAALFASLGYAASQAAVVASDPASFAAAAEDALRDPAVVELMADSVAESIETQLAGALAFADRTAGPGTVDSVARTVDEVALDAVRSPEFAAAFSSTIVEVHEYVFGDRTAAPTIDAEVLTDVVRRAATELDPTLGLMLAPGTRLDMAVPTEDLPHLRRVPTAADTVTMLAAVAALTLALAALTLHPLPQVVVRRFGSWALVTGAVSVAVPTVGPWLLRSLAGPRGAYAAPFLRETTSHLVLPGLALLAFGAAVSTVALRLADARRTAEAALAAPAPLNPPVAERHS